MPERESKFSPGPTFRLPSLDDPRLGLVATDADELRLHAVYYDTDDLRLARAGASFRYRDDQGWVVKLPVGGWTDHDPTRRGSPTTCSLATSWRYRADRSRCRLRRVTSCSRWCGAQSSGRSLASAQCVGVSSCTTRAASRSPRSSTTRCRCSTAPDWSRAFASWKWSSPRGDSRGRSKPRRSPAGRGCRPSPPGPEDRARPGTARARSTRRRGTRARVGRPSRRGRADRDRVGATPARRARSGRAPRRRPRRRPPGARRHPQTPFGPPHVRSLAGRIVARLDP